MLVTINVPASRACLTAMLEGLTVLDMVLMERAGGLPSLYSSGVRYLREPTGRERWLNADELLAIGVGDCEDLGAYRAAELRRQGIAARAVAIRTGRKKFHTVVLLPDKTFEDPSVRLGMKKPQPQSSRFA